MKKIFIFITIWFTIICYAAASDLIRISPVTDKILVLYFDDGHIEYGLASQKLDSNIVYNHPLNTEIATKLSSYSITSEDDPDFQSPVSPVAIGRKSKGIEFNAPWFNENSWVLGHWIYIELPKPLRRGKTYSLSINDDLKSYVDNKDTYTFLFNEFSNWSPVIHVNQIGYKIDAPEKYAYLSQWMGDFNNGVHEKGGLNLQSFQGAKFYVVDQDDGQVVHSGTIELRRNKTNQDSDAGGNVNLDEFAPERNYTHADVWQCDFSSLKIPGNYRIVVEGIGCSYPFKITEDPYFEPFYACMKGLFIQRQGIHKYIEPGVELPRDHHPDDVDVRYNPDFKYWLNPSHGPKNWVDGVGTKVKLWGGYHDAGDWDTYPSHVKVSFGLMMLYDLAPEKFSDGQIGNKYKLNNADSLWINEGTNGLPDILDEARWLMDFYRRGRDELLDKKLGIGGVPGEYFGRDAGAKSAPWQDKREWAVTAESPAATYYLAAMASWYSTCLEKAYEEENEESRKLLQEAKDAYQWATTYCNAHPSEVNNAVSEAQYLAAACLYRATGDTYYQSDFISNINIDNSFKNAGSDWGNPNTWYFAACNYAFLPASFPGLDLSFQSTVIKKVKMMAENNIVLPSQKRAFRLGFSMNRNFSLGTFSTPRMMGTALAYELSGDAEYLKPIYFMNDYCLGGNELNMVQITGLGENPNRYVFHPTSWEVNHYKSKVYSDETLPGMITYFGDDDTWVKGPGDETWMRSSAYPPVEQWPESESRFDSRQSINGSEFTIHQSNLQATLSYGYLTEGNKDNLIPNQRPTVQITFPTEGQKFPPGSDIQLKVKTSPDVARIEYYYNEHYIGEANAAPFSFVWNDATKGLFTITAKVFDKDGLIVRPINEENDVDVKISVDSGPEIPATGIKIENCPVNSLSTGNSYQLIATVFPLNATNCKLTWVSSNPEVITVNKLGELYVKSKGTAKITVTTTDGNYKAECNLVTGDNTVGNKEFEKLQTPTYQIYPNPSIDKVYIEGISELFTLCLKDTLGRIVRKIDNINSSCYKLDISNLQPGLIIMQIITKSNQTTIKKLIKI